MVLAFILNSINKGQILMSISFSVVIPTFNSSNYILETIKSIELATHEFNYEIILVDDCSNDLQHLIEITKCIKNIVLIQKDFKTNAADSRNIGLLHSRGRFVFFLDSDDHFLANKIDHRLNLHKETHSGLIFGNFITDFGSLKVKSNLPAYISEDIRDYILLKGGDVRSSVISIDKEYFKGTLFDKNSYKHQDWIFAIKCWDNRENIIFDSEYVTKINVKRNNRMSSSFNLTASDYFCKEYLKHPKYVNAFCKGNWRPMLVAGDKAACDFFLTNYEPVSSSELIKVIFLKVLSKQNILPVTSILFSSLKKAKYTLKSLSKDSKN